MKEDKNDIDQKTGRYQRTESANTYDLDLSKNNNENTSGEDSGWVYELRIVRAVNDLLLKKLQN